MLMIVLIILELILISLVVRTWYLGESHMEITTDKNKNKYLKPRRKIMFEKVR